MTYLFNDGTDWVEVYDAQTDIGSAWRRASEMWVCVDNAGTKSWKKFHTFVEKIATTTSANSSLSGVYANSPVTISGVVTADVGQVPAGSSILLKNGSTTLLTGTVSSTGSYSFTWTPANVGVYNLTVSFPLTGVYQPSSAAVPTITVSTNTSVSLSLSGNVIGTNLVVSGTVTGDNGQTATGGTCSLNVGGVDKGSVNVNASTGQYSISVPIVTADWGTKTVKVTYNGSGRFYASSGSVSRQFYQPTPPAPSQTVTSISNTGVTLRVYEQADVSYYNSYCPQTGNTVRVNATGTPGTALYMRWDYNPDSTLDFQITAFSDNPTDASTTGNTIHVVSGHAAVTDSGSTTFSVGATSTGSWRSADGWAFLGSDLAQGYYTASYGPYYGVAQFDTNNLRTLIDTYGTDRTGRWQNVSCSKIEVFVNRQTGSGASAAVPIYWYMSTATPGVGGQPSLYFGADTASPSGVATGTSAWLTLPDTSWAKNLLGGTYKSLAMYHNGSANYSQYNGNTGFAVRMTLSWNWTPIAYKAPTWSG